MHKRHGAIAGLHPGMRVEGGLELSGAECSELQLGEAFDHARKREAGVPLTSRLHHGGGGECHHATGILRAPGGRDLRVEARGNGAESITEGRHVLNAHGDTPPIVASSAMINRSEGRSENHDGTPMPSPRRKA